MPKPAAPRPSHDHEAYHLWTARLAETGRELAEWVRREIAASRADCHRARQARDRSRAVRASLLIRGL